MKKILVVIAILMSSSASAGNTFALTQDVLKAISESESLYRDGLAIMELKHLDGHHMHASEGVYKVKTGRYDMRGYKKCHLIHFSNGEIEKVTSCH